MWLTILNTFLDEKDKFHARELRFVEDEERAMRFLGRNWANRAKAPEGADPPPGSSEPVTLDIQKGEISARDIFNRPVKKG